MSDQGGDSGPDVADIGELLELVERLDHDNERLRLRVLEVLEWMEEAVTDQVAAERDLAACRLAVAELTAELEAIRNTKAWRLLAPPRRLYGKIRRRAGGAR